MARDLLAAKTKPRDLFTTPTGTPNAMPQQQFDERFSGTSRGGPLDAAMQGLSFGFSDELLGNMAGLYALMRGKGFTTAGKVRDAFTQDQRNRLNEYRGRKPGEAMLSEIGGALPTAFIPLGNLGRVAQGAKLLPAMRAAATEGAIYGGLYGAGAADGNLADRAIGAGMGAATGAALGGASQPVARGVSALSQRAIAPIRGAINPEKEAARRIARAAQADAMAPPNMRVTSADRAVAGRNAQPMMNIDRGEATRDLARAASNLSPEGRAVMAAKLDPRFEGQGFRVTDAVRRMFGGGKSVVANRELLQSMARKANKPAYDKAYNAPGAGTVWDAALRDLTGAPEVQTAIRQASATARTDAALGGFKPIRNPFTSDPQTGRMVPKKGIAPTLEFWDHVKRNLDKIGTRESKMAARVLRDHLDTLVPEYKAARSGAAQFFGAEDALTAGEAFVTSRMANDEARLALGKMSNPERRLFGEGFADALVRKVMEAGDRRNVVINSMFSSPAARERIALAMGPKRAKELEAVLRVESLLDMARAAMGNSTTARQLVAIGAFGTGYGTLTGDWQTAGAGALAALFGRYANARVAKRVSEMLVSNDPAIVQKGVAAVASDARLLNALRRAGVTPAISQGAPAAYNPNNNAAAMTSGTSASTPR